MSTNSTPRRSWMASAVLCLVFLSLLAAALLPKAEGTQAQGTQAQSTSAPTGEPYAANPEPASVKDVVKQKNAVHRQYAQQQAVPATGHGLS
jgi:hypothetical protein